MAAKVGGLSDAGAGDDIQLFADKVKDAAFKKMKEEKKSEPKEWKAIAAKKQVVNGINWFIKVKTGEDTYVVLRVYWNRNTYELSDIQYGKTVSDLLNGPLVVS